MHATWNGKLNAESSKRATYKGTEYSYRQLASGFRVNGYPQTDFAGKVRRIDAAANATTRQVEVIVDFADPATAIQDLHWAVAWMGIEG